MGVGLDYCSQDEGNLRRDPRYDWNRNIRPPLDVLEPLKDHCKTGTKSTVVLKVTPSKSSTLLQINMEVEVAPYKTAILCIGHSMSFHVHLQEP